MEKKTPQTNIKLIQKKKLQRFSSTKIKKTNSKSIINSSKAFSLSNQTNIFKKKYIKKKYLIQEKKENFSFYALL